MFSDPVNPVIEEIRTWAYSPGALEPMEDWDLILESEAADEFYLALAADAECPQATYFLHVLYLIVGDAVRSGYHTRTRAQVESLLEVGEGLTSPAVQRWGARSRELMADPSRFSFEAWCGGGLANERST